MKRFIIVLSIIIIILTVSVFAKNSYESITRYYNNIKIMLNGQEIVPKDVNGNIVEPFTIDGTTYLPVRAIGNALNLDVDWDSSTNTVILNSKGTSTPVSANQQTNTTPNIDLSEITTQYTPILVESVEIVDKYSEKKLVSQELRIGESLEVAVLISPENSTNKTIAWSSTSPSVASVDENGRIVAKTAGNTTIHATSSSGKKGAMLLKVKSDENVSTPNISSTISTTNTNSANNTQNIGYLTTSSIVSNGNKSINFKINRYSIYRLRNMDVDITSLNVDSIQPTIANNTYAIKFSGTCEVLSGSGTSTLTLKFLDSSGYQISTGYLKVTSSSDKAGDKIRINDTIYVSLGESLYNNYTIKVE